jgi:hypothetical protein
MNYIQSFTQKHHTDGKSSEAQSRESYPAANLQKRFGEYEIRLETRDDEGTEFLNFPSTRPSKDKTSKK